MADFKAMLAARKAAAVITEPAPEVIIDLTDVVKEANQEPAKVVEEQKQEVPVTTAVAGKPLTFAEKIALKKQQENQAQSTTSTSQPSNPSVNPATQDGGNVEPNLPVTPPVESVSSEVLKDALTLAKEDTGTQLVETDNNVSIETQQAYTDIQQKIELLESLEDSQLSGAMSELKKALMANPSAVSLMLDTEIGKMVIALRRITKEAQVEASKEKTGGRTKKEKFAPLSAEAIAAAFEEL